MSNVARKWSTNLLLALVVLAFVYIFAVLAAPAFAQTPGEKDCPPGLGDDYCIIYNQEVIHIYVGDWHEVNVMSRAGDEWSNVVHDVELLYFPWVKGGTLASDKVPDGETFRFRLEEPGMFYIRYRTCGIAAGEADCSAWANSTIPTDVDPEFYPDGYVIYSKPKPVSGGGIS